jgi:hypothetical protein
MRALVLAILLAGCGPDLDTVYEWRYDADCVVFRSELPLLAGRPELYVKEASRVYDARYGEGSFCRDVPTPVLVKSVEVWDCPFFGPCSGYTDIDAHVTLPRGGWSFLHEMFHVHEVLLGQLGTSWHENWDKNGMNQLDKEYGQFVADSQVYWVTP